MKFKATKIATAVATGLGLSVAGMGAAHADSILFPHFVMSSTVTTVLSVMSDDFSTVKELHYRYYYKVGTNGVVSNAAACQEYDFWNPTSANDIVTFDLGAYEGFKGDALGVLFEPTQQAVKYVDDFAALAKAHPNTPIRGYVLVENSPRNLADPLPQPGARLAGDAIVVEFITGSAWGYSAVNNSSVYTLSGGNLVELNKNDFSDATEINGEILVAPSSRVSRINQKNWFWTPTSILPWSGDGIKSAFLVTAVSSNMGTDRTYNASVGLQLRGAATGSDRIMFNRDERAYSGPGAAAVTCVGRVDIAEMVGDVVRQSTPMGGWTNLSLTSGQAIVLKAEINDGNSTVFHVENGTFNNIYMLRKGFRESQLNDAGTSRPLVLGGWGLLPVYDIPGIDNNAPLPVLNNINTFNDLLVKVPNTNPVQIEQPFRIDPARYVNTGGFSKVADVEKAIASGRVYSINSGQSVGEIVSSSHQ